MSMLLTRHSYEQEEAERKAKEKAEVTEEPVKTEGKPKRRTTKSK